MKKSILPPSQPIYKYHPESGRVSLSASEKKCIKGSITVEASIAVPVFFLAVVTVLYLLEMMAVHTAVRNGLQYAGKKAATESCMTQVLLPSKIEQDVTEAIGAGRLNQSIIEGGSGGIHCHKSRMSVRTGIGQLTAEYQVRIPVPMFGIAPVKCNETMKIKTWSGYEKEGLTDQGEETVYITETGTVYHKNLKCPYLDLSVRMVSGSSVTGLRNESGGKYYPCERCGKKNSTGVFITGYGDRYHSERNCSGLKRTVQAVPLSEAAGKGACSKCGQ